MEKMRRAKLILLVVLITFVGVGSMVLARAANPIESAMLFNEVLKHIRDEYVDNVDLEKLIAGAVRGMLNTLDPHSQYLTSKQYEDLMVSTHGAFGGLGIEIDVRNGWLTVVAPIEGTPAHRAGIRGGDRIVKIEGKSTRGITVPEAIQKLRGPKGTQVTITIQREGEPDLIDYTLVRDIIKIKSVPFADIIEDGIGYIKIATFSENTAGEVYDALRKLEEKGMEKLIIDLRRNSGGLLTEAIGVSELFVKPGQVIVSTRGRSPEQNRIYRAGARARGGDYPLVVLVDNQSASASEIVAGAIQDLDRGLVAGLKTFGKGTVQSVMRLTGGGALKLTTAKYYTPSGRNINKEEEENEESAIIRSGAEDSSQIYYTIGGRRVFGGGGIRPDLELQREEIPKIASRLAKENLVFEYAVHYVAVNKQIPKDFAEKPDLMDDFIEFIKSKGFEFTQEEFEQGRDFVLMMLETEIARKVWGDEAAYRIDVESDKQVQKVVEILKRVETLPELLALASQSPETIEKK